MSGRFRDGNGKWVSLSNLPNVVPAFCQSVARKFLGRYPREPWIPFSAAHRLDGLITKETKVWEIGAGYSTLWLADRAAHVVSIEADQGWHTRLSDIMASEGIQNVDLRYLWRADDMARFEVDQIDLAYIDGGPRDRCLINAPAHVKRGGYIYCDNTDNAEFWGEGGFGHCLAAISQHVARVEYFSDYVPAMVGVSEGAVITLK